MRRLSILIALCALAGVLVLGLFLLDDSSGGAAQVTADASSRPPLSIENSREPEEAPPREPIEPALHPEVASQGPAGPLSATDTSRAFGPPFLGRVLDARGQPVTGADVYLASSDRSSGIPLENLDPEKLAWAHRAATSTDEGGRFQISPLSAGALRLGVRARGFAPFERSLSTLDLVHDLRDIVLTDGAVLTGRVLDSGGRPVSGALVRKLDMHAKPEVILAPSARDIVATTDVDGAFRIEELPSGPWMLSIKADGHPDKLQRGETKAPGATSGELTIVLEDGVEIRGRVLQVPNDELPDLWVIAIPKSAGTDGRLYVGDHIDQARFAVLPQRARCASDGSFVVRGLTRDQIYRLAARKGENEFFARARTAWVEARAGETGVQLVYKPASALVFQVVDDSTSRPVTAFEVRVGSQFMIALTGDDGNIRQSFTDGRVQFEHGLEPRGPESVDLVIEARGYKTKRIADLRLVEAQDLDLGIVRLEPFPILVVRVLDDATGKPVTDARVTLIEEASADASLRSTPIVEPDRSSPSTSAALNTAQSDRDGTARLNSLPGKAARLRVVHADFASFQSPTIILPALGDREETVRLHAGGRVVVEVKDAVGVPARGVRIRHVDAIEVVELPRPQTSDESKTDARGQLTFTHLGSGAHRFLLDYGQDRNSASEAKREGELDRPRSDAASEAPMAEVIVSDGSEQTVTLVIPTRGRLTGRVTEGGQPLSGATLRLAPRDTEASKSYAVGEQLDARTNGKGDYSLNSIELGMYSVSIVHPGRAMAFDCDVRIDEALSKFDVDLPLSVIEGRIVDEDNKSLAGVRVRAERARSGPDSVDSRTQSSDAQTDDDSKTGIHGARSADAVVFTQADGGYTLRGVQSEVDLVVMVQGDGYQPARSEILRVARGEIKSGVDLKVLLGAVLEVTVNDADGRPASLCRIVARSVEARSESEGSIVATTGAGGSARFTGLRPGPWHIRVDAPANGSTRAAALSSEQVIDVVRGDVNTVKFVLQ